MSNGGEEPVQIAWQPEAPNDLARLIPAEWHGEVADILVKLKLQPKLGERLHLDERTGDLSDCRKVRFGPDHGRGPIYRLVSRLLPDNYRPATVEIVAMGPKDDLVAYVLASVRLDR